MYWSMYYTQKYWKMNIKILHGGEAFSENIFRGDIES